MSGRILLEALVPLFLGAVLLTGCGESVDPEPSKTPPPAQAVSRMTLTITGMTCDHCVQAVERSLRFCSGVARVEVNLEKGQAVVDGDGMLPEEMKKFVEEKGFKVTAITEPVALAGR